VSAARAVLQTGEFDYAWNLLVEDDILQRLERDGSRGGGQARIFPSGNLEFIQLNFCDPATEREGERAHPDSRHPLFSDAAVRSAMALLIDRRGIQQFIYGRAGEPTANFVNAPARFRSPKLTFEHSLDKANATLDAAGWKKGKGGIREKDGKPLKLLFQTSINAPRQKAQQVIKQAAGRVGIEIELKAVTGAVFFSSDVANPDTYTKFWADMQMYTTTMTEPDPERLLDQYVSWELSSKANKWQGRNNGRWRSPEYDSTYRAAQTELDPVKRAALLLRCNELASGSGYIIPLVSRSRVAGVKRGLQVQHSGWDNDLWNLSGWWREA
jgi:peptide/nickel transport system substrate-binding protein